MSAASDRARLLDLLGPVAAGSGVDLEDVQVTPAGRRRVVRVVVDADDGVGLDRVAEVSRSMSEVMDASDTLGSGPYVLEVSSPGVERPLTAARHWRRATGRLVRAVRADGSTVTGRVTEAGEAAATLVNGSGPEQVRYDTVTRASVQVEFTRHGSGDEGDEGEEA